MIDNIKKYYAYQFFSKLSFWLPIYILFFLANELTYTQIYTLSATAAVFQIAIEIPSGAFADLWGRANSLKISSALKAISMLFYIFGKGFVPFLIAYIFFGISLAFDSGASSAFLYDTLRDLKMEKRYKKIQGNAYAGSFIAMAIGSLVGSLFFKISFMIPIVMTFIGILIATAISLTFKEPKHKKKETSYFAHMKEAVVYTVKHPRVKWLIFFSALITTAFIISHKFDQEYMKLAGIDLSYFGIIYALWLFAGAIIAKYAHEIENFFGEFGTLTLITLLSGVGFLILGKYLAVLGIFVIMLREMIWGITRPVIENYVNQHIDSHNRATVLSLDGFLGSVMIIILAPALGYVADVFSLQTALFILGIIILVIGLPLSFKIFNSRKWVKA